MKKLRTKTRRISSTSTLETPQLEQANNVSNNIEGSCQTEPILNNTTRKIRKFKCEFPECDKVYRSKENLVLHIDNKHLGKKPFECIFCQERYASRNTRATHEREVHYELYSYPCPYQGNQMVQ